MVFRGFHSVPDHMHVYDEERSFVRSSSMPYKVLLEFISQQWDCSKTWLRKTVGIKTHLVKNERWYHSLESNDRKKTYFNADGDLY
jgi:hypothetical protein